jgi:hypothetical protein
MYIMLYIVKVSMKSGPGSGSGEEAKEARQLKFQPGKVNNAEPHQRNVQKQGNQAQPSPSLLSAQ